MSKKKEEATAKRVDVPLFGDVHKIYHDTERDEMRAEVMLAPAEIERMLEAITTHYANGKSKRKQRIAELAKELGSLLVADCSFFMTGHAYISGSSSFALGNSKDHLE